MSTWNALAPPTRPQTPPKHDVHAGPWTRTLSAPPLRRFPPYMASLRSDSLGRGMPGPTMMPLAPPLDRNISTLRFITALFAIIFYYYGCFHNFSLLRYPHAFLQHIRRPPRERLVSLPLAPLPFWTVCTRPRRLRKDGIIGGQKYGRPYTMSVFSAFGVSSPARGHCLGTQAF